jgi:two-component system chemotaxis response regulator CheB
MPWRREKTDMANTDLKKTRVMIVDDSPFMCKVLREIIHSDPQLEVIGEARDGREAVALAESLWPDVITMDIEMPHVNGLQAIEIIMSQNPRPIVVVSSAARTNAAPALRALELGAIDCVPKPTGAIDLDIQTIREELTRKLKRAAKVRVIRTASRAGTQAPCLATKKADENKDTATRNNAKFPFVVIAASTGGPAAVARVIAGLPADFPGVVLLVLHMPATFTKQFLQQLAEISALPVKELHATESAKPGVVYLCPGSHHLRISPVGNVRLDAESSVEGHRYRPSADMALESAAEYARSLAVAVVLTGMGNDGTKGAKAVKAHGGYVIAQDEASSTIFGMPGEAIKAGAVDEVLPLDSISAAIVQHVTRLCQLAPTAVR